MTRTGTQQPQSVASATKATKATKTPSSRIIGIDVARALAVIGMFYAHVGRKADFHLLDPSTWDGVVVGRASVLFVILSGVGLGIMTRGLRGEKLNLRRRQILFRGVFLFLVGGALEVLNTHISVILATYSVLFWVVIPMLKWRTRTLAIFAGVGTLAMPLVTTGISAVITRFGDEDAFLSQVLATGHYPVITWTVFLAMGIVVGRLNLADHSRALDVAKTGALMCLAYPLSWALCQLTGVRFNTFGEIGSVPGGAPAQPNAWGLAPQDWYMAITAQPHTGMPLDILGAGGVALVVIGLCVRFLQPGVLVTPLVSLGRMSLTVYSAHLVVVFFLLQFVEDSTQEKWLDTSWQGSGTWALFTAGALVFATVWFQFRRYGPLEELMRVLPKKLEGDGLTHREAQR